jgi:peroxiredoxin
MYKKARLSVSLTKGVIWHGMVIQRVMLKLAERVARLKANAQIQAISPTTEKKQNEPAVKAVPLPEIAVSNKPPREIEGVLKLFGCLSEKQIQIKFLIRIRSFYFIINQKQPKQKMLQAFYRNIF